MCFGVFPSAPMSPLIVQLAIIWAVDEKCLSCGQMTFAANQWPTMFLHADRPLFIFATNSVALLALSASS